MRYKPRYTDPIELLRQSGYKSANRGWKKRYYWKGRKEIHALIGLDGTIDLHEDYPEGKGHITKRRTPIVHFALSLLVQKERENALNNTPNMV